MNKKIVIAMFSVVALSSCSGKDDDLKQCTEGVDLNSRSDVNGKLSTEANAQNSIAECMRAKGWTPVEGGDQNSAASYNGKWWKFKF